MVSAVVFEKLFDRVPNLFDVVGEEFFRLLNISFIVIGPMTLTVSSVMRSILSPSCFKGQCCLIRRCKVLQVIRLIRRVCSKLQSISLRYWHNSW